MMPYANPDEQSRRNVVKPSLAVRGEFRGLGDRLRQARNQAGCSQRDLGVNLDEVVAKARQHRWLQDNREALHDANRFLEKYGLWSDGRRQF
jgi:ribosome-binding protein aMBF1 (putative translation factor)